MTEFRIHLLDKVKCKITGFWGRVTARYMYPNGCIRLEVLPVVDKEGKYVEPRVFDEGDLEIIEEKKAPEKKRATGGPPVTRPVAR
jgi:hypothetical protein